MGWIKRNLFFVISVVIGLGLTGYCGYLLYSAMNDNSDAASQYNNALASLQQLQQQAPFPSKENIAVARVDEGELQKFLGDFRKRFQPFPTPPAKDDKGFSQYLEDSLVRFRAGATNAGVELPPQYEFSFSSLLGRLNYAPGAIAAWMQQLEEISAILDILYEAKINYLETICRVPVAADDSGTGDCLLQTVPVTNVWGIVTPYRITFRGFSEELAAVLEGFARSSNCFIVKSVEVTGDKSAGMAQSVQPMPQVEQSMVAYTPQVRMPVQAYVDRGGPRLPGTRGYVPRPVTPVPQAPVAAPVMPLGPTIILREEPLSVTILVDVVKLKASEH